MNEQKTDNDISELLLFYSISKILMHVFEHDSQDICENLIFVITADPERFLKNKWGEGSSMDIRI